jgi:hypothetical protein
MLEAYVAGESFEVWGALGPLPDDFCLPSYMTERLCEPDTFVGKIEVSLYGVELTVPQALAVFTENDDTEGIYPLLWLSGTLWRPARCPRNLLVALCFRLHKDPFEKLDRGTIQEAFLHHAALMMVSVFDPGHQIPTFEESVQLMPACKRERIRRAHMEWMMYGNDADRGKSVFVKSDETINLTLAGPNGLTMKPRGVTNLNPISHAMTLPYARWLAACLKSIFDGTLRTYEYKGVRLVLRIKYAAGLTQSGLDELGKLFMSGDPTFAACGDDSLAVMATLAWLFRAGVIESDYSAFDHSQKKDSWASFLTWGRGVGLPDFVLDQWWKDSLSPYKVKASERSGVEIRGKATQQMPTGLAGTTVINTGQTIGAFLYTIWRATSDAKAAAKGYAGLQAELGYTAKVQFPTRFQEATFLRGWWEYDVNGVLRWTCLPSAVLKLTKVCTKPSLIGGYSAVAASLAGAYSGLDASTPLVGALVTRLSQVAGSTKATKPVLENEQFKARILEPVRLDRQQMMLKICQRYGVSPDEVEEAEAMILNSPIPGAISHRVFNVLRDVDYG